LLRNYCLVAYLSVSPLITGGGIGAQLNGKGPGRADLDALDDIVLRLKVIERKLDSLVSRAAAASQRQQGQ
jgi:hypothetical protein